MKIVLAGLLAGVILFGFWLTAPAWHWLDAIRLAKERVPAASGGDPRGCPGQLVVDIERVEVPELESWVLHPVDAGAGVPSS
jgi:hypothetical protein